MNYFSYYKPTGAGAMRISAQPDAAPSWRGGGSRALHSHAPSQNSWYKTFEVAVGALLLLSPMFWLFIAELIK